VLIFNFCFFHLVTFLLIYPSVSLKNLILDAASLLISAFLHDGAVAVENTLKHLRRCMYQASEEHRFTAQLEIPKLCSETFMAIEKHGSALIIPRILLDMTPKLNSLLFQEYQYFLKRADG
jgi:hypothetical protein